MGPELAIGVALERTTHKSRDKRERKWKLTPGSKWPKMAAEMEKNGIQGSIFPFQQPFLGHFGPEAILHFFSHFSRDFCVGQVFHSVDCTPIENLNDLVEENATLRKKPGSGESLEGVATGQRGMRLKMALKN